MSQFGKRIVDRIDIAAKVSRLEHVYDGSHHENPMREVQMFGRLQPISSTDTIVRVIEVAFTEQREHCIIMERCNEGTVLEQLGNLRRSTPTSFVQKLFRDLIAGLRRMHDRGMCHLDLRFDSFITLPLFIIQYLVCNYNT